MDDVVAIEIDEDRQRDRDPEKPDHPEKSQPDKHPDERHERMQADLFANNARLDDVAHHENEHIEEQQPKRQRRIAEDGDDDRPRNEDAAGAEDWQDVEDRHAKADQDRVRDLQQRKTDRQLDESDRKDQRVGFDVFHKDVFRVDDRRAHRAASGNRDQSKALADQLVKIGDHEKRRDDRDQHSDEDPRQRRQRVRQKPDAAHRIFGDVNAHVLHCFVEDRVDLASQRRIHLVR